MIISNLPTRKLRHRTVKQLGWGCCWQAEGWDLDPGIETMPTRSAICDNASLVSRSLGDATKLGCLERWPQQGTASSLTAAPRGTEEGESPAGLPKWLGLRLRLIWETEIKVKQINLRRLRRDQNVSIQDLREHLI